MAHGVRRLQEPLSEKYKDLYRLLQKTPLLMTQERITNNGLLRKRISCGGSEVCDLLLRIAGVSPTPCAKKSRTA